MPSWMAVSFAPLLHTARLSWGVGGSHSALGTPIGRAGCEAYARGLLWASETQISAKEKKKAISHLWLFSRLLFYSVEHCLWGKTRKEQVILMCSAEGQPLQACFSNCEGTPVMWLTGSWCSGWVSGLSLWGGRAEFRTLDHQRPPAPRNINWWEFSQRLPSQC